MFFTILMCWQFFVYVRRPGRFLLDCGRSCMGVMLAFIIFVAAAVSDYLDGYLARKLNQTTLIGKVLDPIADKAMVIILLSVLFNSIEGYWLSFLYGFPSILIIFRELFISGLREYSGDVSKFLTVTKLSKWKTTFQLFSVGLILLGNADLILFLPIVEFGLFFLWIASLLTIITGIEYLKQVISILGYLNMKILYFSWLRRVLVFHQKF